LKPFMSLCLIVKDEEKVLKRCLESVKDVIDEIIVVDTGSTDKTKEIALNYTEKLYSFKWTDSFSDARNFAQSKATGQWILVLDADEYVDKENLAEVINKIRFESNSDVDAFEVKIYNFTGLNAEGIIQHNSLRIYRNIQQIYYYRAVHEQLARSDQELSIGTIELIIYHSGYLYNTVKEKNKSERNVPLIEKEVNKKGYTGFDYFNMGNEYLSRGNVEKALESFVNAYKNKPDFRYSWVSFCLIQIVKCLDALKRYSDALAVIEDAEGIYSLSPDFKCIKANIYLSQHRYKDAEYVLLDLINNKDKYKFIITSVDFLESFPHEMLGRIYEQEEDYNKAVFHYVKALGANKANVKVKHSLFKILSEFCTPEDIVAFINEQKLAVEKKDKYSMLRLFINIAEPVVVGRMISLLEKEDSLKKGFLISLSILKGDFSTMDDFMSEGFLEEFINYLKSGCIDLNDIIIHSLQLNTKRYVLLLASLISEESVKEFLNAMFEETYEGKLDSKLYTALLERVIQLKQFEIFERVIVKGKMLNTNLDLFIGNILFKNNFKAIALEHYDRVPLSELDEEAFVNIITTLSKQENSEDTLEFCYLAIQKNFHDFRIFKYGIEALKARKQIFMDDKIIATALDRYGDSRWIKENLGKL
jgi:glycosyltransferase involved in cell wall biosynthesis